MAVISLTLGITGADAVIIPGVDSIYPTANAAWSCSGGAMGVALYCQTDNSALTFGFTPMLEEYRVVFRNVMTGQFNPTDLNVVEQAVVFTGSSETDIVYQVGDAGAGNNGITWCDDAVSAVRCDQHYVRVIPQRINDTSGTPCHESGHAVGLTHGANASPAVAQDNANLECMRTPSGNITTLGVHNVAQINGVY